MSASPEALLSPNHFPHSRDPGGVDAAGMELISGQDPVGLAPEGASSDVGTSGLLPPTPTRVNNGTPVMALLVGAPPPPPPTPPPPKKRSSSRKKARPAPITTAPSSKSETDTATTANATVPSSKTSAQSIVEQRRQAAMQIYESERLVLDPPEEESAAETLDIRLNAGQENKSPSSRSKPTTPKQQQPFSPVSQATELHSNLHAQQPQAPLSPRGQPVNEVEAENAPTPNRSRPSSRPKTPERVRRVFARSKTPEKGRRRSKTPDGRRSKTPDRRKQRPAVVERRQSNDDASSKNKRGFFRKMFGKKKSRGSQESLHSVPSSEGATRSQQSGLATTHTKSLRAVDSGGEKSSKSTSFHVDNDRPEVFFAHDEISTLTAPTVESNRRKSKDPEERVSSDQSFSEPAGHYWNHFSGFGGEEKKDESPEFEAFFPSPKKSNLRVDVGPSHDPVGESPLYSRKATAQANNLGTGRSMKDPSPRGFQSPALAAHPHNDPFGESPLHQHGHGPSALVDGSPFAGDPPLFLEGGFVSDDSVVEDKVKSGQLAGAIGPPPPPPATPSPKRRSSQGSAKIPSPSPVRQSLSASSPSHSSDSGAVKETIEMAARSPRVPVYPRSSPSASSVNSKASSAESSPSSKTRPVEKVVAESEAVVPEQLPAEQEESAAANNLKIASMARINAQAVAYIHTLNGDPSPRSAWQKAEFSDDDVPTSSSAAVQGPVALASPATSQVETVSNVSVDSTGKLLSTYSGKFRGRKPPSVRSKEQNKAIAWQDAETIARVRADSEIVAKGFALLREKRENEIASGRSIRVVPVRNVEVPVVDSYFEPREEPEPKDPIQRAGRRLLAKAAIPIQAAARRHLAQRAAVDRMWALIELQSYFRRFRAEAYLYAHVQSAKISAATQIQRIVRGFLAAVRTYYTVYSIVQIQARVRGDLVRQNLAEQSGGATVIQTIYRGFQARKDAEDRQVCALLVQTQFRSFSARVRYQLEIVDIIITQSIARSWLARREHKKLLEEKKMRSIVKIQSFWRGFQAYTDFIFTLVDILIVQRTVRAKLARRKTEQLRRERATLTIQTEWRRYSSQMHMLYDLVHIIVVQSVARRYLATVRVQSSRSERALQNSAATKIETAWRSFWAFSQYVIMQFEVTRLQAMVRGNLVRKRYSLRLGCAIMIQSVARKFLAVCKVQKYRSAVAIQGAARRYLAIRAVKGIRCAVVKTNAKVLSMRETRACQSIQFWWRVVLDCRKEKAAALIIERFFIMVKREVDREIRRVTRKKKEKKSKSSRRHRSKKKVSDDQLLEKVWLNTVDENHVDVFAYSPSVSMSSSYLEATPSNLSISSSKSGKAASGKANVRHRASSPDMDLVMRHEMDSLQYSASEGGVPSTAKSKKSKKPSEKYLKMYGLTTADRSSNDAPTSSKFFNESMETPTAAASQPKPSSPGKTLVMNPYPDIPSPRKQSQSEYVGEEFGLI